MRHCERQRSNPGPLAKNYEAALDCFVAIAPRNDEFCLAQDAKEDE
jgi:hypothetical protein